MPAIVRLNSVTLYMYADDHPPPHFHMRGPRTNALVRLDDLEVLEGEYDRRDHAAAVAWASEPANRTALATMWSKLNERD